MAWSRRRRWTDDELCAAVARSSSYVGTMRALGLKSGGAAYWTVKQRIEELALDVSHFAKSRHLISDEVLRAVVARSTSFVMVLQELGRPITAATHTAIRRLIARRGIDASHLVRGRSSSGRRARWSDEQLRTAVATERSLAGVLRALGLMAAGGNYEQVHRRIEMLGLDTSGLVGKGWSLDRTLAVHPNQLRDILVENRLVGSHQLKLRLFRAGLKTPACELCGWAKQAPDGRIPVELDHINGERTDNRLENLRILCPNCHALQPTHRGLNQRRRRSKT